MSAHLQRARSLFEAGLIAEAEKEARRALAGNPGSAEAHMAAAAAIRIEMVGAAGI